MAKQKQHEIDERRAQVASLLLERTSLRDMEKVTGVPRSTLGRDVVALREQWARERSVAQERAIDEELQRLNALEKAYWRLAVEPNAKTLEENMQALDKVLKIMERRAKLLGLDAPKRFEWSERVREVARAAGLTEEDAEEAVKEAQRISRGLA